MLLTIRSLIAVASCAAVFGCAGTSQGLPSAAGVTAPANQVRKQAYVAGRLPWPKASTSYETIWEFSYFTGANPLAGVIADKAGNLYGTASNYGPNDQCCGVVFALTHSGYAVLYDFQNGNDGAYPYAGLAMDKAGALYGTTTSSDGGKGGGTVFKLSRSGSSYTESTLHEFGAVGGSDGAYSTAPLMLDKGWLYGTTEFGGSGCSGGCGTVFKVRPSGAGYAILHAFQGGSDGAYPLSGVLADKTGALYGTTVEGGGTGCGGYGCGTVFKLTRAGSGYNETILHAFRGGNDGAAPWDGRAMYADSKGELFGTTAQGGGSGCNGYGCGTVFDLRTSGADYGVLYAFTGSDGDYAPNQTLIAGRKGTLYGADASNVFALTPSGSGYVESVLQSVPGLSAFSTGLIEFGGSLYGTTYAGGVEYCPYQHFYCGTVFKLTP